VVDEGHNLGDAAAEACSTEVTSASLRLAADEATALSEHLRGVETGQGGDGTSAGTGSGAGTTADNAAVCARLCVALASSLERAVGAAVAAGGGDGGGALRSGDWARGWLAEAGVAGREAARAFATELRAGVEVLQARRDVIVW